MRCSGCRVARRYAQGAVKCILYGIIISENHECELKGARPREEYADNDQLGERESKGAEDDDGAAEPMPVLL